MKRILIILFITIGLNCHAIDVYPSMDIYTIINCSGDDLAINFIGEFVFNSEIRIEKKSVKITGECAVIKINQTDGKNGFYINASNSLTLEGISFIGNNNCTTSGVYVYNTLGKVNIDKCSFTYFKCNGLQMEAIGNVLSRARNSDFAGFKLTNTVFDLSEKGLSIGLVKPCEYWLISGCTFNRLKVGVTLGNAANGTINNSFFTECTNYGIYQTHLNGNAGKITVNANKFNHNAGISIYSAYISSERPFIISANQFIANANTDIEMRGDRHSIIGNQLNRSGAYYIKLYGKKCIVSSNQYWQGAGVANFLYAPYQSSFIIKDNLN